VQANNFQFARRGTPVSSYQQLAIGDSRKVTVSRSLCSIDLVWNEVTDFGSITQHTTLGQHKKLMHGLSTYCVCKSELSANLPMTKSCDHELTP